MKWKIFVVACMLYGVVGCAFLQEHAGQIQTVGKAAEEYAPLIAGINPIIGAAVLILGSLAVAIGTSLQKKEK